ncbi:PREDICTED: putative nuclease HARBI1 [Rhagoletis zephyria]|uniref:putative nuclease HARBI1 n=1 Tax=Rhagoletis zephyria TaxID=28612 RepID=UPI0008119842|nr:PREDICTED: putative nuclease HARBI1 [Rhagoletis zephyria]
MSRCLIEVCKAIEKTLCQQHINFASTDAEETEAKLYFYEKCGIPGVLFAIDGTHIQMIRPTRNEHLYYNRKLKHSMNAMVMCDHKMRIRAVDARYGGAYHDSHVWNLSSERRALKARFDNGERGIWSLGDSGYPLEPWMLTPYRNAAENSAEGRFNHCHAKGRSIIERVFGILKGRFRCLLTARELHYTPQKVSAIMNVCCALHNICLQFKAELQPSEVFPTEDVHLLETVNMVEADSSTANISRNLRDEIRNSLIA